MKTTMDPFSNFPNALKNKVPLRPWYD